MYEYLLGLITAHPLTVYLIIAAIALPEGPFLSITSGALLFAGYLHFIPLYAALVLGDLIGDIIWYFIGYHYGQRFVTRFGKYFKLTDEHIVQVKEKFHSHTNWILLISKISNGFGLAIVVLFTAGMSRVSFVRFMGVNFLGQLVWSGMLIGVGYFFSHTYTQIGSTGGKIGLIVGGIIALVAAINYGRYIRREKIKM